jgi:hypothetical protein
VIWLIRKELHEFLLVWCPDLEFIFRRLFSLRFLAYLSALKFSLERVRLPAKMPFSGLRVTQLPNSIVFRFAESQWPAL